MSDSVAPVDSGLAGLLRSLFPYLFNSNSDPTGARSGDVSNGLTGDYMSALGDNFAGAQQTDASTWGGIPYSGQDAAKALLSSGGGIESDVVVNGQHHLTLGTTDLTPYTTFNADGTHTTDWQAALQGVIGQIQAGNVAH